MIKKTKKIKILFLDILTDNKYLRKDIEKKVYVGKTYAETMQTALGLNKNQFVAVDASSGRLPDPQQYSAIVMGGSVKDPVKSQEKPWMKRVYKFIREAQKNKIPILGICGGLQFTVKALGGEVVYNSKGRNFGNSVLELNKSGQEDMLFKGLPKKFFVQSSHKCIAQELKSGWRLLGSSRMSPLDAIAIGNNIRLVQFHPEMRAKNARLLAKMRKKALIEEGFTTEKDFPKLLKSFKDTSSFGKKILKNFLVYFAQG